MFLLGKGTGYARESKDIQKISFGMKHAEKKRQAQNQQTYSFLSDFKLELPHHLGVFSSNHNEKRDESLVFTYLTIV